MCAAARGWANPIQQPQAHTCTMSQRVCITSTVASITGWVWVGAGPRVCRVLPQHSACALIGLGDRQMFVQLFR